MLGRAIGLRGNVRIELKHARTTDVPSRLVGGFKGRPRASLSAFVRCRFFKVSTGVGAMGTTWGMSTWRLVSSGEGAGEGAARVLVARKAESAARVKMRAKDCIADY